MKNQWSFPDEADEAIVDSFCFVPGDRVEIKFHARSLLRIVVLVPKNLPTDFDVACNGERWEPRAPKLKSL